MTLKTDSDAEILTYGVVNAAHEVNQASRLDVKSFGWYFNAAAGKGLNRPPGAENTEAWGSQRIREVPAPDLPVNSYSDADYFKFGMRATLIHD